MNALVDVRFVVEVRGVPAPQGSKNAIPIYKGPKDSREWTGRVALQESSSTRVRAWRSDVKAAAEVVMDAMPGRWPLQGPLAVRVIFTVHRPKSHYGSNGALRPTAPARPTTRPDLIKLARSTEDALKAAGVFVDDSQIVEYERLAKVYVNGDPEALPTPGARVEIRRL